MKPTKEQTDTPTGDVVHVRPGWWEAQGSRVCLFDIESELSALHWAFFDEVGASPANFLYLAGLRAAVALIGQSQDRLPYRQRLDASLRRLEERGYGRFKVEPVDAEGILSIVAEATVEAHAYLRRQSQSQSPVCNYTRGLLAGVACMCVAPVGNPNSDIVCWETNCVACRQGQCRFVLGTAQALAEHGYQNPENQQSPRWALESLNTQLRVSHDQLREAQSRLRERQQAYQHLLDNMLDPLLVIDQNQRIVFFNLRFLEIAGLTGNEAVGTNPLDLIHPEDRSSVEAAFQGLISGQRRSATFSFRVGKGSRQSSLECSARTILTPSGEVGVEAICRDVTERENVRRALEAANRKLVKRQRLADNDLRLAKLVHESLLPKPIDHDAIKVDVKYVPVERVGGDYCYIATVDQRFVVLTLCDVSGHGMAAALLASRVNSHLSEQELVDPDPWALTLDMNAFLQKNFGETGMFVTFLAVTIDLKTFTARICGAGHPGAIHWCKETGETKSIPSQHLPIGIIEQFHRQPHFVRVQLDPGDRLVLYTDGIIEAADPKSMPIRAKGLEELVQGSADVPIFELGDHLLETVTVSRNVRAHDDMTLMLVEMHQPIKGKGDYSYGTI